MEMSLDITPRRQLEEKLEASETKYYAIFDNIPNPVFVMDRKTLTVIDCNRNVFPVYGFSREEILGKPMTSLFPEGDGDGFSKRVSVETVMKRVKHKRKDGTPVIVDLWISKSEFSGEKVYIVITSDITRRLETENQLMQAGKLATLGEMSTGVAHELNQPLSVIKTAGSFILKKLRLKEPVSEEILGNMIEKIDRNVDRASKIITHMRQFARKTEMDMGGVQVNGVMERALDIFSQQLKVRGIEIVCDLKKDLPEIKADPDRLEQVFINLLINARDAVEGRWENRGRRDERNRIFIRTDHREDRVTVSVRDTGTGIPDKIKDKIFEPFFTTKEVGKGTGLGLSISYGIVRECGGTIGVTSREGEGAEFILEFPVV
ncbi:MAG: PAS domain S-box protein [Deltaproteobacteria bacterium]|nr:PAS domain S-box protein [Deltaproteobacteria bacterium]